MLAAAANMPVVLNNISPDPSYQAPPVSMGYTEQQQQAQQQQAQQQTYPHPAPILAHTPQGGTHGLITETGIDHLAAALTSSMHEQLDAFPHDNCTMKGHEMQMNLYYKNKFVVQEHVEHEKGMRIYWGPSSSEATDPVVMHLLREERHDIMLPHPKNLLEPFDERCIKYIEALLQYMPRGLIIECHDGDIYATRLCRTAAYYATYFTQETKKIERPENKPPERMKIFDYETFEKAMLAFERDPDGNKTPYPEIHLFIGQRGTAAQFTKVLICAKIVSCKAQEYCNKVLKKLGKPSLSLEISAETSLDRSASQQQHHQQQQQQQQHLQQHHQPHVY